MGSPLRQQIAFWTSGEKKSRFAALASSHGMSQSKLLGLVIDKVLARNPVDSALEEPSYRAGRGDKVSLRLRPGDGKLLRQRAQARGMKYSTYAAALIRAHLRASPPMPLGELAQLERSVAEVSALAKTLRILGRHTQGTDDAAWRIELSAVVPAVERVLLQIRELGRANLLSWEADDGETR
jgi:hypothetical protein